MTSNATRISTLTTGMGALTENMAADTFIKTSNCGMMMGKPKIAMIAAFCCALAAIAARKVNTRLRLQPPKKTIPRNAAVFCTGQERNNEKITVLKRLITSISTELKSSFANTKFCGDEIEW